MRTIKRKVFKSFKYIYLILASFISVFPFIWMIIGVTNKSADVTSGKFSFGNALFENVRNLFTQTKFATGIKNSLIMAFLGAGLTIIISSLAGYGFEIYKSKAKDRVMQILLLSMMIPFAAILIPLYRLFAQLGWTDTYLAAVLPSTANAFLIFFFRQSTQAFPKELLDAARVDGLGEIRIFFQIYFPTMKSTFAAASIISFMAAWNNYLWPLVILQSQEKMNLPVIVSMINSNNNPDFGQIMVAVIIMTLPTALIFFLMQKQFVQGMVGSIK